VSSFPTDPDQLQAFLLQRSAPEGASPAPMVTPPPNGAPTDGQLWRAITDLLADPHTTPTARATLVEVAANLQGSTVTLGDSDPVGRSADVIAFANWGGDSPERLYVDPSTHDLLAWTVESADGTSSIWLVRDAGVSASTDAVPGPNGRSIEMSDAPLPSGGSGSR